MKKSTIAAIAVLAVPIAFAFIVHAKEKKIWDEKYAYINDDK